MGLCVGSKPLRGLQTYFRDPKVKNGRRKPSEETTKQYGEDLVYLKIGFR